jgi:uncharacterized protein YecT (DUF1311 family)
MVFIKNMKQTIIKTRMSIALTLLLVITMHMKVFSQEQAKVDCSKASTQTEMLTCANNEFINTDKQLNDIYKKILIKLSDQKVKQSLIESQRKWISFRNGYANVYQELYNGGSMMSTAMLECEVTTTRLRIEELNKLYEEISR